MERVVSSCSDVVSHTPHWLKMFLGPTSLHREKCVVLLDLTFLPFYFNLTFPVFFHSSVLMHPEHHTDLDNLDTVESDLRHSAKGSNDAYDVTHSLTIPRHLHLTPEVVASLPLLSRALSPTRT